MANTPDSLPGLGTASYQWEKKHSAASDIYVTCDAILAKNKNFESWFAFFFYKTSFQLQDFYSVNTTAYSPLPKTCPRTAIVQP